MHFSGSFCMVLVLGLFSSMVLGQTGEAGIGETLAGGLQKNEVIVQGAIMDTSNKFIQRGETIGTNYYHWNDMNKGPTFRRREVDFGKRFVMFPDRSKRIGTGHFIVLRRMYGFLGLTSEPVYEGFRLRLTDMVQAWVTPYRIGGALPTDPVSGQGQNMMSGATRFKRDSEPKLMNLVDLFGFDIDEQVELEKFGPNEDDLGHHMAKRGDEKTKTGYPVTEFNADYDY